MIRQSVTQYVAQDLMGFLTSKYYRKPQI